MSGIRSLTEFGNPVRAPSPISALPPGYKRFEASPKAISERTSYLRVRLAFHPYPHLLPAFFNIRGFAPPGCVTWPSPGTWVGHRVSGLRPHTKRALIKTRFRFGSVFERLAWPSLGPRRSILQKVRRHPLTG